MKKDAGRSFGLTDIAMIAGAVVLALVVIVTLFGDNLRRLNGASAAALAGSDPYVAEGEPLRVPEEDDAELRDPRSMAEPSPAAVPCRPLRPRRPPRRLGRVRQAALPAEPLPTGNTHDAERPNPFTLTSEDALSTFAVDVDTASYALFRRYVNEGSLPPRESVRVEEWVNYFKYRLPTPTEGDFRVDLEGTPSPFTQGAAPAEGGAAGAQAGQQRAQAHAPGVPGGHQRLHDPAGQAAAGACARSSWRWTG